MRDVWKTIKLSNGTLTLEILPHIGGRLWDIVYDGRSLLFQNEDLIGCHPDLEKLPSLPTKSPQFGFPLWGGEKTWIAPDKSWADEAPFPVLDSGPYQILEHATDHIMLESGVCPLSHLAIQREIRISGPNQWTLIHRVKNHGTEARETGVWSVMMLKHPTRVGVCGAGLEVSTVFGKPDGRVLSRDGQTIFNCDEPTEYKVAASPPTGRSFIGLAGDTENIWLTCERTPPNTGDRFAHAHPLEVFNSGDYPYCEAEWHGPSQLLASDASMEFKQTFTVWAETQTDRAPEMTDAERELIQCMY